MSSDPISSPPAALFGRGGVPALPGPGRTRGSRNKLASQFFDNLYGLWGEQGEAVLRRAAFQEPMQFAAMVAKLMPQKLEISTPTDGMSEERFAELLDMAERMQALSAARALRSLEQSAPMTIEGSAVVVEEGGYPEVLKAVGGKDIELVHTSSASPDRLSAGEQNGGADFAAGPIGEQHSVSAIPPSIPIDLLDITACPPGPGEEDIDPLSLF